MKAILVIDDLGYIGSVQLLNCKKNVFEVVFVNNLKNFSSDILDGIFEITGKKMLFEKIVLK